MFSLSSPRSKACSHRTFLVERRYTFVQLYSTSGFVRPALPSPDIILKRYSSECLDALPNGHGLSPRIAMLDEVVFLLPTRTRWMELAAAARVRHVVSVSC